MRGTYLCALRILEALLKEVHGGLDVEVHDKIRAASEDAKGGFAGEDVCAVCHGEYLGAEGVPWITAL